MAIGCTVEYYAFACNIITTLTSEKTTGRSHYNCQTLNLG